MQSPVFLTIMITKKTKNVASVIYFLTPDQDQYFVNSVWNGSTKQIATKVTDAPHDFILPPDPRQQLPP